MHIVPNDQSFVVFPQAWGLGKVQTHRPTLQRIITRTCDMVHRDQFNACLVSIGLRDSPQATVSTPVVSCDGASEAPSKPDLQNTSYAQVSRLSYSLSYTRNPKHVIIA